MVIDQTAVSFAIRFVHVASMAVLLGGSVLVWMSLANIPRSGTDVRNGLDVAVRYEWLFWAAMGLLIMTGVGNLGVLGRSLPGPETSWGQKLTIKLMLAAILMLGSVLRTILTAVLHADSRRSESGKALAVMRTSYGATVVLSVLVVLMALALAHG
ncbi:MAG: hypothetical protein GEU73_06270 [Chloroflexi bacterium]|nr:hypothetical protein [Chloroflexota bacterium]